MTVSSIRKKLIADIKSAPAKELKEIYRLHLLVAEEKAFSLSWKDLSENQKKAIEEGIAQLDTGKGIPAEKVTAYFNKKYGIPS